MNKIIISRTDSIGDVVLTLPICRAIKDHFPGCKIIFLGRRYTQPVAECCEHVDAFLDWDEVRMKERTKQEQILRSLNAGAIVHVFPGKAIAWLAKAAGIPLRIGTSHRFYHWLTCNERPSFTRKNSDLHEAQLNFRLLSPLGVTKIPSVEQLKSYFGFSKVPGLPAEFRQLTDPDRFNLILHPRSKGSAREWGLRNFSDLVKILPEDKFKIFMTGTAEEGKGMKDLVAANPRVHDLSGKLSLPELISFIKACDGLVAASTGPLHLAAVLGKKAIGIYSPMRPIHPGRWMPIGDKASYLSVDRTCSDCRKSSDCHCIREITAVQVMNKLLS